jgi:hypothetical protein
MGGERFTKIKNVLFVATHPISSLKAKARQVAASIELQAPPHTSTWEEFPELPLADAVKAIKKAEGNFHGGVPKEAWSKADQERMSRGELPKGVPGHPNV